MDIPGEHCEMLATASCECDCDYIYDNEEVGDTQDNSFRLGRRSTSPVTASPTRK